MIYRVLRDCYCEERFFRAGDNMELAEGLDKKYPKNFQLVEETPIKVIPTPPSVTTETQEGIGEPELYVSDKPYKSKRKKKK